MKKALAFLLTNLLILLLLLWTMIATEKRLLEERIQLLQEKARSRPLALITNTKHKVIFIEANNRERREKKDGHYTTK